jgi:hypothetical protein
MEYAKNREAVSWLIGTSLERIARTNRENGSEGRSFSDIRFSISCPLDLPADIIDLSIIFCAFSLSIMLEP